MALDPVAYGAASGMVDPLADRMNKQADFNQTLQNDQRVKDQQVKQTDAMLQRMGFVKHDVAPYKVADLEESLKQNAQKAVTNLHLNLAPDMPENKKVELLTGLHKAYNFELPKPNVSTTVSVDKNGKPIIDYDAMRAAGAKAEYPGVSVSPSMPQMTPE